MSDLAYHALNKLALYRYLKIFSKGDPCLCGPHMLNPGRGH